MSSDIFVMKSLTYALAIVFQRSSAAIHASTEVSWAYRNTIWLAMNSKSKCTNMHVLTYIYECQHRDFWPSRWPSLSGAQAD